LMCAHQPKAGPVPAFVLMGYFNELSYRVGKLRPVCKQLLEYPMNFALRPLAAVLVVSLASLVAVGSAHAAQLIGTGSLSGSMSDMSGLTGTLENGVAANLLGGMGSGLAWAGGDTFLALPDRGPNAAAWNSNVDDTTSYIARFNTVNMGVAANSGAGLPYSLTPTLSSTTLLWSATPLNYGTAPVPTQNTTGRYYFTGRSDGYDTTQNSLNANNSRLDPEGIRVSNDGKKVYVSDEYGPYVYEFDRATGQRTRTFALPGNLGVSNLSPIGNTEINGNTSGRVANKGMEGLAITPDGKTLIGFMQSPLIQDSNGGVGKGQINRMVQIDIATGAVKELAYNNKVGSKTYNSSEILALNDHDMLVLERDGSGLGNGDATSFKSVMKTDITGLQDITTLSGEANLLAKAGTTTTIANLVSILNAAGIPSNMIPAKLEGMAFWRDMIVNGVNMHVLLIGNDNDFVGFYNGVANPNVWYMIGITDADLGGSTLVQQSITTAPVPEPETFALALTALAAMGLIARRRRV
jgi:hypothetical protein